MHFIPLALNFLLMVSMPLLLGWYIVRRRRVSWGLFGMGAVTFILAQVGHIPFNYLAGETLFDGITMASRGATLLVTALFLGFSAALFEEGGRYLCYRWWAKDARSWGRGLMVGAGHGGAESILLGVIGALNATILLGYRAGYFQGLIPDELAPQVYTAVDQLAALPWFELMFGALERALVLTIQLALSLLVMQAFVRARLRWLFFAIGWHALVDAVVVVAVGSSGVYAAEALVGIAALISLLIIVKLKRPEPEAEQPEPLSLPLRTGPIQIKPTREKMEESRYL